MPVGLIHFHDDSLQVIAPLVGLVQRDFNVLPVQLFLVDNGNRTVHPDRIVDPRNHENQADVGIGLSVPPSLSAVTIEDLHLSTRTQNSLRRGNLATVGHVLEKSATELLELRNFGEQSLNELVQRLREMGVAIPEDDEDRAWRRAPLATLVPSAEGVVGAGAEQGTGGDAEESDDGAVFSMRPDEDVSEVDLTHYSRRSFAPDDDDEE